MMQLTIIQQKIYEIRGHKVKIDFDLAELYEVETRAMNQAVKRNFERFPKDFMFQLTASEWRRISSSQIVMMGELPKNRTGKYLPYAFTEHGVTMLASVLKSKRAVKMNIGIVRAFIALRQFAMQYKELAEQIAELRQKSGEHDGQLNQIYEAIEKLLSDDAAKKSWQNRPRIGFNSSRS